MRKRSLGILSAATLALSALALVPAHADDESDSAWSVHCQPNTVITQGAIAIQLDPILAPGGQSSHLHEFFGNKSLTSSSTPHDLKTNNQSSTCGQHTPTVTDAQGIVHPTIPDGSAYWTPGLSNGTCTWTAGIEQCPSLADPAFALIYYRNEGVPHLSVHALPNQLQMIAGDAMSTGQSPMSDTHILFTCVYGNSKQGYLENTGNTIPSECPDHDGEGGSQNDTEYLRMVVYFPNCIENGWTGPNGDGSGNWNSEDSSGNPGMKYATNTGNIDPITHEDIFACDTGYYPIPQVQIGVRWVLSSAFTATAGACPTGASAPTCFDLTNAALTSDDMPMSGGGTTGLHGVTGHGDFMNGWTTDDSSEDPVDERDMLMGDCFGQYTQGDGHDCGYIGGGGS